MSKSRSTLRRRGVATEEKKPRRRTPKVRLTRAMIRKLAAAVEAGLPLKSAATRAGTGETSVRRWRKRAAEGGLFAELDYALEVAEARLEAEMLGCIVAVARKGTWTAAAWYLERTQPEKYSKRAPVEVQIKRDPVEMLSAMGKQIEKAGGADAALAKLAKSAKKSAEFS